MGPLVHLYSNPAFSTHLLADALAKGFAGSPGQRVGQSPCHRHLGGVSHRPFGSPQLPFYCRQIPVSCCSMQDCFILSSFTGQRRVYDRPISSSFMHKCGYQLHGSGAQEHPGNLRVIVDLSAPTHNRVKDDNQHDHTHVTYSSINEAALLMHYLGKHHDQNRCPRCLQANSNPPHES